MTLVRTNMATYEDAVNEIKGAVSGMIEQRNRLASADASLRSTPFWQYLSQTYSYVMELSPGNLRNLRLHTGIIDGDLWRFRFPYPQLNPDREAKLMGYEALVHGLPEEMHIGEPRSEGMSAPVGVEWHGRIINWNIARFQRCVADLYHAGLIGQLLLSDSPLIVEIGGGYGGLALQLTRMIPKATYITIDLPEMLFFSGVYLAAHNPHKPIILADDQPRKSLEPGPIVLVPNYALHTLSALKPSLVINMESFPEMTAENVREYLSFFARTLTGLLYTNNVDSHPQNPALGSLSDLLENDYAIYPDRKYYENFWQRWGGASWDMKHRTYLCAPKQGASFPQEWAKKRFLRPAISNELRMLRLLKLIVPKPVLKAAVDFGRKWYVAS
jgi:hypothetical protein